MNFLGSLTNRIFLASAALAVVSIVAAVYFVSRTTTREAEAELQRGLIEAGTLVDQQTAVLVQTLTVNAAQCTPNSPSHSPACAIINTSEIPAPPDWQYVPKAGTANNYPTGSFFEGGVDK